MFENSFIHFLHKVYSYFIKVGSNLQSLFLLYMRLTWGHQFFITGLAKFGNIDMVAHYFQTLHIGHPLFNAYLVATVELIGGLLLFVGFASRMAAVPLIILMLTALSTAHVHVFTTFSFFFEPASLVQETPYPFLITSLLVFIFGPGRISIDGWIKRWVEKQPKY